MLYILDQRAPDMCAGRRQCFSNALSAYMHCLVILKLDDGAGGREIGKSHIQHKIPMIKLPTTTTATSTQQTSNNNDPQ